MDHRPQTTIRSARTHGLRRAWSILILLLAGSGSLWGAAPALAGKGGGNVNIIRLGSPADVTPSLNGPSFFLDGSGAPTAAFFDDHIDQVATAPLDIVVLAASFASGNSSQSAECEAIIAFSGSKVNSCETITITKATGANDSAATADIAKAEIVYFAGGDQCNYVGWKGSSVYNAVLDVAARGGGVGGGSAGEAIQGEYIYDGCQGSATSSEALANPYDNSISFTYDFFHWPHLGQIFTDSHFVERNRMGRLMSFLARQIQDGKTSAAYGLGIDRGTAVLIDSHGHGQVYGNVAYVVLADHQPEACAPGTALTFSNYKIWKLPAGSTYNFANRPTSGYYLRSVADGVVSGDPY
ncbi:MAG: cyanophycinase [Roseiflexaceae bacterium]